MKDFLNYILKKTDSHIVEMQVTEKLYSFTPKTLLSSLTLAVIFFYIFYEKLNEQVYLVIWFTLIVLLNLSRLYDYKQYIKTEGTEEKESKKWYNIFKIKSIFHAILWSLTSYLFIVDIESSYQLIVILFIIGLAGGVTGFIFDFIISSIFISLIILPLIVMLSFSNIEYFIILQVLLTIFYILLMYANNHLNRLFYQTYKHQERYQKVSTQLRVKERKLSSLLEQTPIGIFYYDETLKIVNYNTMFYKIFGIKESLNKFDLNSIKEKEAVEIMKSVLQNRNKKGVIGSYEISFQEPKIWVQLTCSSLFDEKNHIIGGIGTIEDKTIEHEAYEKINYISRHDELTQLPNRRSYKEYMREHLRQPKHKKYYSILFYMDLNHFKQINDTFGHTIGDKLLLEVAKRLKELSVMPKYISRIGGDEFILVVPFVHGEKEEVKKKAQNIAMKIKECFLPAFEIEELDLYVTSSIGIVLIDPKSSNTEQIIRQADMAMYQTKREGLNNIRFYDQSLDLQQRELTSLQHDLKKAIHNNELVLYYQPIVSIDNNSLNAIEALVRWNHPSKGLIMPDKFIPMATESGLITKVGWWVAKEVCRQLAVWKKAQMINFDYISININARQLNEVNFVEQLDTCITKGKISPSLLKLELTETTLLKNFTKTQEIITRLKNCGIECSIDDFGTGYSSLSYLKKIAFKVLKIDKVFIDDILTNIENQELVKSIIDIGQQFNYKIIIEGIETEAQKNKIIELNHNVYYQGYLCSKAIPAEQFEKEFLHYMYHI